MNPHTQPTIFHRFWWIIAIILAGLIGAFIYMQFFYNRGHGNENQPGQNNEQTSKGNDKDPNKVTGEKDNTKLDSRIVATFSPTSKTAFEYNPPTMVGGYLYIGTSTKINLETNATTIFDSLPDQFFYKMGTDLKPVWTYNLGKTMVDGGATLDSQGNIYFVSITYSLKSGVSNGKDAFMTKLDLVSLTPTGTLRWTKPVVDSEMWQHAMLNVAISTDDKIYVGGQHLHAFNTAGDIIWQYPNSAQKLAGMRSSPIIDPAGNVYFTSPELPIGAGVQNIRAYKFAPNSKGTPVWSTVLGNNILENEGGNPNGGGGAKEQLLYSSPAFAKNAAAFYIAVGNTINKVDTATGKVLWAIKPPGATGTFKEAPAVDATDTLYIGSKSNTDSNLYAITAAGAVKWQRAMGADMYPSPLLGDDGKLYAGSEQTPEGAFHAIDTATGATAWAIGGKASNLPDFSYDSPLLDRGYVYFGIFEIRNPGDPALFKVKVDAQGYLPGAASPRFRGGNDNTGRAN